MVKMLLHDDEARAFCFAAFLPTEEAPDHLRLQEMFFKKLAGQIADKLLEVEALALERSKSSPHSHDPHVRSASTSTYQTRRRHFCLHAHLRPTFIFPFAPGSLDLTATPLTRPEMAIAMAD